MELGTEIDDLKDQLERGYEDIHRSGKVRLAQTQEVIAVTTKELLVVYSNDVRNLGIVAGTVAPFSLALLTVEKLDINVLALIVGFGVLLFTIGISQYFLFNLSSAYDKRIGRAQVSWVFAEIGLLEMRNEKKDQAKRANAMFDYEKYMSEAERLLGLTAMEPHLLILRRKLRTYSFISLALVSTGMLSILGSIALNPILDWILRF